MSSQHNGEQQRELSAALRRQTDRLGSRQPLELADVQERARGIRRRRYAVSGLAAAALLAVVVPTGVAVTDRLDRTNAGFAGPATPAASSTPSASSSPKPVKVRLSTSTGAVSGPPQIPFFTDGEVYYPTGDTVTVHYRNGRPVESGSPPAAAVEFGSGFMIEEYGIDSILVSEVASNGQVLRSWDSYADDPPGWLDGVHFLEYGGLAVVGSDSPVPGTRSKLLGVSPDGDYARLLPHDDAGSCSAVFDLLGNERWRTCDHTLGTFSPDGRYILGRPAPLDGIGDSSVAILDAATGAVLASFESPPSGRGSELFVGRSDWDADGMLLSQVNDRGRWVLLRLSADGELSQVEVPQLGSYDDPVTPPLTFVSSSS